MKRFLTLLAFAVATISSYAYDCEIDGIHYNLSSGKASVARGDYSGSLVIPKEITYSGTTYPVTSIAYSAFSFCTGLKSVSIPKSVTSIGEAAFWGCSNLTFVTIPESVASIGESAFADCSNLTSIIVEQGNTKYDSRDNCNALIETSTNTLLAGCKNTTIPNSVTSIGDAAFHYCSSLNSIEIPNSVTNIGESAFYNCSSLTSIEIPNSVTRIRRAAFMYTGLTSITIPNSVTSIENSAFSSCFDLTSVTIPNSVTSIENSAFSNCLNLTSVTIPNSVTKIKGMAFSGCSSLNSVTNRAKIPQAITSSTFEKYGTLHVPKGYKDTYSNADYWKNFTIVDDLELLTIGLTDGIAYNIEEQKECDELTYTRTFKETLVNKWNALYVPISIDIESYLEDFDFAEIFNISTNEDTNRDGEIDGKDANKLIVNKLKTGTTVPNKPYLIRPKNAGTYTFASADKILYPAEEKSYSCSTMTDEYTFTGLYASRDVIGNDKYYMTINGVLDYSPTKTITVKPNRWIMTVKSRNGSSSSNAKAISLSVIGEDEGTTAIEHVDAVRNADVIYNLNGVKMDSKNLPAGIYIKNGKKVIVK